MILYNDITNDTRKASNEKVDKNKRYTQILSILKEADEPMTAKEVAIEMYNLGFSYSNERNISAPRLTELETEYKVKVVGKKTCQYSGKTVAMYEIGEEE